jgi:hypothetical protein
MWYRFANQFSQPATYMPDEVAQSQAAQLAPNEAAHLSVTPDDVDSARLNRKKQLRDPETDPLHKTLEQQLGEMTDRDEENNIVPESMQSTEGGRGEEQLWRGDFPRKQRDVGMPQSQNWPASQSFMNV